MVSERYSKGAFPNTEGTATHCSMTQRCGIYEQESNLLWQDSKSHDRRCKSLELGYRQGKAEDEGWDVGKMSLQATGVIGEVSYKASHHENCCTAKSGRKGNQRGRTLLLYTAPAAGTKSNWMMGPNSP